MSLELRNYMKTAYPGMEISKPGYLKQRMKLNPLAFNNTYTGLGDVVGKAFSDGLKLK